MRAWPLLIALAGPVAGQDAPVLTEGLSTAASADIAPAGIARVLDKITGSVFDMRLQQGQTGALGELRVTLEECRYPVDNPAGDAFQLLAISYRGTPLFHGWMVASAPALNGLDHPRFDVWALRCTTS